MPVSNTTLQPCQCVCQRRPNSKQSGRVEFYLCYSFISKLSCRNVTCYEQRNWQRNVEKEHDWFKQHRSCGGADVHIYLNNLCFMSFWDFFWSTCWTSWQVDSSMWEKWICWQEQTRPDHVSVFTVRVFLNTVEWKSGRGCIYTCTYTHEYAHVDTAGFRCLEKPSCAYDALLRLKQEAVISHSVFVHSVVVSSRVINDVTG